MKIKYIIAIFLFFLIMLVSRTIFHYLPYDYKWLFTFISGEIGFIVLQYFLNHE